MLSVKVVTVDYYIARPIKYLKEQKKDGYWLEPVIRIFGPTSDGIKTCVHIHGVYPYLYVPYRGGDNPDRDALLLGAALDQALAANSTAKNPKFIYKVILTSGIPLYGYHSKPRQFFKVFFFNPHHLRKAIHLLLSGAILGQRFQPHEAHIPFTLQFMMDYNIYGMSFITLEKVKYRRSPSESDSLTDIPKSLILPQSVKRTTHSYWEVDALAEDILNVRSSRGTVSVNPGLQAIWEDEKIRRRAQDRTSQITPQTSQSRPEVHPTANELMHKRRLAQKLQNVIAEAEEVAEKETPFSYPAEVPENATDILEASFVGSPGMDLPTEELLEEVNNLIDEKILTQMVQDEESESEGEQAKIEDDSVLGRNQRDDDEAELQDEDGGDMTQPLEMLENVISGDYHANRDERGDNYDSEDEFWKSMADKIMQLDGADDISSLDSDEENRRSIGHPQFLNKADDAVSRILESSNPGSESISNWSNNIMSILTDSSGFPGQQVYQTSQNFWSNWSPKMNPPETIWTQNNADAWTWDRNDSALLDCLVKTGKSGEESFQPQSGDTVNAAELYGFPSGEYFHGNYTPTSTMSPISNVGSAYNISPPSAILTPCSEMDSYSDVNLDSISQISNSPSPQEDLKSIDRPQVVESKTVTVPRAADVSKSVLKTSQKDLLDLLRNFSESRKSPEQADGRVKMVAATLQQYIKTCGEIMNVDFKNISGKEMIVIEYKPVNSKSNQNKYLIKPLDKFLEDWNSMEKLNNSQAKAEDTQWPRLINGFSVAAKNTEEEKQLSAILNTLENKYTGNWLDESKIKSIKNKFIVKSIEMLPDSECVTGKVVKSDADKLYKVNENVISDGKIKMRLIKDRKLKNERTGNVSGKVDEPGRPNLCQKRQNESEKVSKLSFADCGRTQQKEKCKNDNDKDLIDQINRSFEDYFKSIVKVNVSSAKNEVVEEEESTSGEDEPESETESEKSSANAIKFITQLLSMLASLSHSSEVPPLSMTINFGNGKISPSVQFNLQPGNVPHRKRRSKKLTINNFDGPADSSSSEDSVEGKPTPRTPSKKRLRKDVAYRPLNVVIQKTPATGLSERKRKLPSRNLSEEVIAGSACADGKIT
ncbi:UNVERIFIED_CONTAM: hypothetical protein PYX00_003917 [Menopon gallinae]|uniref:DNA polymerase zeta catalytic subunit n=1 Tax=Menopon gallinae TaxID=328185 RepID=A0AAW2I2E4_9NEOP